MRNIKIDLHTHSILSPDGGLSERDYTSILKNKILDCIAITDHNDIALAKQIQQKLGQQIIIGEEVMTQDGEIIGLFLTEKVESHLSAEKTVAAIKKQKGLVYIPHPFETFRKGINETVFQSIKENVDIVEVFNGRSMQPATRVRANEYANKNNIAAAASSDSHCRLGIGKTYSVLSDIPDKISLVHLLKKGTLHKVRAPWLAHLCPKFNRLMKMLSY
jgi:predicted metal-dependent phosphoesterase TrpH